MVSRKIVISAPSGLHARPAGELVKIVKSFSGTKVTMSSITKCVNAASMLSVLSLGLKCGSEVEICAEGAEERIALDTVCNFLEEVKE